jgi:HlyD family secretion protein
MSSRRNLIFLIIGLAVLAAGAFYFWQQQQAAMAAAATQIREATITRGTLVSTVSATGPLSPETQVNLFFGVAGVPVAEVAVDLGDVVRQGDVLARLDTTDLTLALEQARHNLRTAELAVAQLTAAPRPEDVAAAEANLKLARSQLFQASQGSSKEQVEIARLNLVLARSALQTIDERVDDLIEQGKHAEKSQLDGQQEQARENARIAELRYEQALNSGRTGGSALSGVEQAEIALDRLTRGPDPDDLEIAQLQRAQAQAAVQQAENNLKDALIVAPFEGVVAAVNARVGEVAGPQPAVVLADVSQYYIDVSVDEVDVARIAAGQAVTITLDALPSDVFTGVVEKIAPQSTLNAGVVSYPVRVIVQSAAAQLRGGMTATAEIVVQEARDVVVAPNWAIRRDRATGQAFVSVLRSGQLAEVEVQLGLRNEAVSEILVGLSEGDVVGVSTAREQFSFFGGGN